MTVLLLEAGYQVISLDNFSNSHASVLDGIFEITGKSPIFYEQDITDIS
jgi:UDP-glucose 4-epimerase